MSVDPALPCSVGEEERSEPIGQSSTAEGSYQCDLCGQRRSGPPGGSGLLIWTRGAEVRYDEPPLCEDCATKVTMGALLSWSEQEEEGS